MMDVPLPVKLKKVSVAQDPLLVHVNPFVGMVLFLGMKDVMIATKPTV